MTVRCCQGRSCISHPQHAWSTSIEWDIGLLAASYKPHGSMAPAHLALMDPGGGSSSFSIPFLANLTSPGDWESSGTWLKAFPSRV